MSDRRSVTTARARTPTRADRPVAVFSAPNASFGSRGPSDVTTRSDPWLEAGSPAAPAALPSRQDQHRDDQEERQAVGRAAALDGDASGQRRHHAELLVAERDELLRDLHADRWIRGGLVEHRQDARDLGPPVG